MFEIEVTEVFEKTLKNLQRQDKKYIKKLSTFLEELKEHPATGTGHPEILKDDLSGLWSRKISREHRLVYDIDETNNIVTLHSCFGHYTPLK